MSMGINLGGVYTAPVCLLSLPGMFNTAPVRSRLLSLQVSTGANIGTATVAFPGKFARDFNNQLDRRASVTVTGRVIFRGVVASMPLRVSGGEDCVEAQLVDDRWLLMGSTIGQMGVGDYAYGGFKDVGFDLVFNPDGLPNRNATAGTAGVYDYCTASSAAYWTLADILIWIFAWYVDSDLVTLDADVLTAAAVADNFALQPSGLDLSGKTALQAINTVVDLAGVSWCLDYTGSVSAFAVVALGSGRERTARVFAPGAGATADSATVWHLSDIEVMPSIRDSVDVIHAISAPLQFETTYTTAGDNPLLVLDAAWAGEREYKARYLTNPAQYAIHLPTQARSAGAQPLRWMPQLITRSSLAATPGYLSRAQMAAAPAMLADGSRVLSPVVWIQYGEDAERLLVTGGVKIDTQAAALYFEESIDVKRSPGSDVQTLPLTISDWTDVDVWLTVVTEMDIPEGIISGSAYLDVPRVQVVSRPDLVPMYRYKADLPIVGALDADQWVTAAAAGTEKYIDVTDRLNDAAAAVSAAHPQIGRQATVSFDTVPDIKLGDALKVRGRDLDLDGSEVVVCIRYRFEQAALSGFACELTNELGSAVDPERFAR